MDDREKLVLKVLREALDLAPPERDRFVSRRCGDDAALHARVEDMLRGLGEDEVECPEPESASWLPDDRSPSDNEVEDPLIGSRLGVFRVIERIGRGGMGIVYRGEREGADFSQEVALKLIRRGFDFDDVQTRFLRERRILARLSHPNLARFIDGGVGADGRPWFALEFVRGAPISRWCDAQRFGIRERVRLFLDVCAAVQHAHTQLVVHRDLKPGNILVDDSGAVRLLDFGVAGLLSGEGGEGRHSTIGLRHAMTPEYAAPEQFGGDVGVAADVYALGVILYELVSGVLPYEFERGDLVRAERIVRETPPQSLTAAMSRESGLASSTSSSMDRSTARSPAFSAIDRLHARSTSLPIA